MDALTAFIRIEIWVLLVALAAVVTYKLLTGSINTRGILRDKVTGEFSLGRLQMLIFTLAGAALYVRLVLGSPTEFPRVPEALVWLVGGSNFVYLGGKSFSALFRR